jgi:ApaG protein
MTEQYEFRIEVEPRYIEKESDPETSRYVFAYTITISNTGTQSAQLMHRHWVITNGDGERQEVRGKGVVGEQPLIPPGESFRYTSAAVLETAVGAMHGSYEFEGDAGKVFDVPIPAFSLSVPNVVH